MTEVNGSPENPLGEALPNSLDILFNKDPMKYTEQDIVNIVKALREKSALWKKEEAQGKKKSSTAKAVPITSTLTLDDLDL